MSFRETLKRVTDQNVLESRICVVRYLTEGNTCTVEPIDHAQFDENIEYPDEFYYDIKYSASADESTFTPGEGAYCFVIFFSDTDGFITGASIITSSKTGTGLANMTTDEDGNTKVGGISSKGEPSNKKGVYVAADEQFVADLVGPTGYWEVNQDITIGYNKQYLLRTECGAILNMVSKNGSCNIEAIVPPNGKIRIAKSNTVIKNNTLTPDADDDAEYKLAIDQSDYTLISNYVNSVFAISYYSGVLEITEAAILLVNDNAIKQILKNLIAIITEAMGIDNNIEWVTDSGLAIWGNVCSLMPLASKVEFTDKYYNSDYLSEIVRLKGLLNGTEDYNTLFINVGSAFSTFQYTDLYFDDVSTAMFEFKQRFGTINRVDSKVQKLDFLYDNLIKKQKVTGGKANRAESHKKSVADITTTTSLHSILDSINEVVQKLANIVKLVPVATSISGGGAVTFTNSANIISDLLELSQDITEIQRNNDELFEP